WAGRVGEGKEDLLSYFFRWCLFRRSLAGSRFYRTVPSERVRVYGDDGYNGLPRGRCVASGPPRSGMAKTLTDGRGVCVLVRSKRLMQQSDSKRCRLLLFVSGVFQRNPDGRMIAGLFPAPYVSVYAAVG